MLNVLTIPPSMKPLTCRALFTMVVMAVSAVSNSFAQPAPPPVSAAVEVSTVKFRTVNGGWYEVEVELQGKAAAASNRNYINRVKVALNLGIFSVKAAQGAKIPDTYYRASAEAVAIESSGKTAFRFYLPPEIVKRDQISGQQRFYLVEVSVEGKAVPLGKNDYGNAFMSADVVESFRSKVASESTANDGILVPQHLTPFAFGGQPAAPTVIRVENTH